MGKYPVTTAQYAEFLNAKGIGQDGQGAVAGEPGNKKLIEDCMNNTGKWDLIRGGSKWKPVDGYRNHPVIYVTGYGVKTYAVWVDGSLPTQAQPEYACRAGTTIPYSYGDDAAELGEYAWYSDNNDTGPGRCTKAMGLKKANPWGLFDMHKNAAEWCLDTFNIFDQAYAPDDVTDPLSELINRCIEGRFHPLLSP